MPELTRNGVKLVYDEAGSGGPALLFVHGFGGAAHHFGPQMEHFESKHRVVAVDRRGHGRSDKPQEAYSVSAIADDLAWTARELGLHKPVVVVHSMGVLGLELTARHPELASALVVLDAPMFIPAAARQAFVELGAGIASPGYADVIAAACDRMIFLPTDDRRRRAALHAALLQTPHHVLASTWREFLAYDPAPAARACRLPLLYIGGVMPNDDALMRELIPAVTIGRTVGAGHFHQLEVPAQVNAMIDRFLELATRAP